MLFCSYQYVVFFLAVFAVYWALPWQRARVYVLLGASYYFYASWNSWLALVVFASATVDYFLALGIARTDRQSIKKLLVSVNVVGNLCLLCYFKYANFFLDSLSQLAQAWGFQRSLPVLEVILPVGISFYTFEAINYVVDVYRGSGKAERNLANFLLFILFFPHLVAGPIVRARDFLPQIHRRKHWQWRRAQIGVQLIILGLIKKLLIADRLALLVDPVFADPTAYRCGVCWLALLGYAMQLYGDFSGYSDLAMGSAFLLGYRLAWNFNLPYIAVNTSDFWRRWHISLSSWLRDYLYIPLGGNRGGRWFTCRNLLITMTLCGLWHGATGNCILFGLSNGILLLIHRLFRDFCEGKPRLTTLLESVPGTAFRIGLTFLGWCLTLVFFRSQTFSVASEFFARLVTPGVAGLGEPLPAFAFAMAAFLMVAGHVLAGSRAWERLSLRLSPSMWGVSYGVGLSLILLLAPPTGQTFIYFQF